MNIENAVRNLTDLSAVDDRITNADGGADPVEIELRDRRAALRGTLPDVVLSAYDALARIRRRPVVVGVRSAHCGGCHLRLPPQLDASIRRRQSLSACPHCRRLLYPAPPIEERKTIEEPIRQASLTPPSARTAKRAQGIRAAKPLARPRRRAPAARRAAGPRPTQKRGGGRRSAASREGSAFELELSLQPQ